ncbi:hypothetical protein [Sphingosinicella soli]|uniref:Uncharacterized protein n=1 Tax=Sphingosinicella soli TaxID=333708 RepID=A0A7W7B0Y6_9SPHN|nr:hypothetical protein [Sphingosinicella soli]MBB4632023.1 hypothetical protein [Sphingosinicella soli]
MPAEVGFLIGLLAGAVGMWLLHVSARRGAAGEPAEAPAETPVFSFERELETRRLAAENAALMTQMEDVRERLATLERLAIDRSSRLADEIEALRA